MSSSTTTNNDKDEIPPSENSKRADGKLLKQEKQRRWEAKQERQVKKQKQEEDWEAWIRENASFASLVKPQDVQALKTSTDTTSACSGTSSPLACLLQPYLDLQDGAARRTAQEGGEEEEQLFIAEGTETIRLLVQQSSLADNAIRIRVQSIFCKPSVLFSPPVSLMANVQQARVGTTNDSPPFHVLVGAEDTLSSVAGFQICRGALACGVVPADRDEAWLFSHLQRTLTVNAESSSGLRILALDGISDTANLGSMIRCASAFGVCAILLSRDCCDAWYRRSVRVSMGHIFRVPCVRVDNLAATIKRLAGAPFGVTSYAAVIDVNADLILENVQPGAIPKTWCCVMGNEANGISKQVIEACSRTMRIGMVQGVDSLSVPVATGILLHGLQEKERDVQTMSKEASKE